MGHEQHVETPFDRAVHFREIATLIAEEQGTLSGISISDDRLANPAIVGVRLETSDLENGAGKLLNTRDLLDDEALDAGGISESDGDVQEFEADGLLPAVLVLACAYSFDDTV